MDYPDPDDGEYHTYRATGSNLSEVLHNGFGDKSSLIAAINEDLVRTRINTRLLSDKTVGTNLEWQNLLVFADSIKNNAFKDSEIPNLLDAINWIQNEEIGTFNEDINPDIVKEVDGEEVTVETITEALNVIFDYFNFLRDRIGYDTVSGNLIDLTTDAKETLTDAINEVD